MRPEVVTDDSGRRWVRVRLRTETGTIVYADLGPQGSRARAQQLTEAAYSVQKHNSARVQQGDADAETGASYPDNSVARTLVAMVRKERGTWTEARFAERAHAHGVDVTLLEAYKLMQELTEHKVLREGASGRFVVV